MLCFNCLSKNDNGIGAKLDCVVLPLPDGIDFIVGSGFLSSVGALIDCGAGEVRWTAVSRTGVTTPVVLSSVALISLSSSTTVG